MNQLLQAPTHKFDKYRTEVKGESSIVLETARRKSISPFVFVTQSENKAELDLLQPKLTK